MSKIIIKKRLYFNDPVYGASFICGLLNYRDYIIINIPNITQLDNNKISEEERILIKKKYISLKNKDNFLINYEKMINDVGVQKKTILRNYSELLEKMSTIGNVTNLIILEHL